MGPAPAVDLVAVLPGVVAPWLGASRFVAGASDLAARVGIPPLVGGLTLGALGTALPCPFKPSPSPPDRTSSRMPFSA